MKSKWHKKIADEGGIAALEFAIVFPFFLTMILFLFEFAYQQILMNLVERYAMQATIIARTAKDPSKVKNTIESLLAQKIPKWMYSGKGSKPEIVATYGDTLQEVMLSPNSGFGDTTKKGVGQTVCLKIGVKSGVFFGWLPKSIAPVNERTIVNCYVNWDVNWEYEN